MVLLLTGRPSESSSNLVKQEAWSGVDVDVEWERGGGRFRDADSFKDSSTVDAVWCGWVRMELPGQGL